jgi:RimJ/RimL family protein N-acetyltransferase
MKKHPFNHAGMRLYERFGFRPVGLSQAQRLIDRHGIDTSIMEKLLAES